MSFSRLGVCLSFFFLTHFTLAQAPDPLRSPQSAVKHFLENLQEDQFYPEQAALPFLRQGIAPEVAEDLAIKLKQILDGEGIYIDIEEIPAETAYMDTSTQKARYVLTDQFADIYLERSGQQWKFSRKTIQRIPEIHAFVYPFGMAKLLDILPKIGTKMYFGFHTWQLVVILLLSLFSVLLYYLFTFIFDRVIHSILRKQGYEHLAEDYILPLAKPFSFLVVVLFVFLFIPLAQLPVKIGHYVILGLKASIPLLATLVVYRMIDIVGAYLAKLAERTEGKLDDQLVPIIRKTLKAFVVVVGGIVFLQNLNFNITALLAGISIGGLAVALAAQDTLKNFFGSVMIFLDRPFQIGDWISAGEIDGTVEEVGFRTTRVRTFRNSLVSVPNGKLSDMVVDNHGMRQYRRFFTQIAITYDTPPEKIEAFVAGLRHIVENHPDTRKDYFNVFFNDLGAFSLNIMFYIFFQVPDWTNELRARHEILLEIVKLADKLEVRFAFPTQTLHVEDFPGQQSLSPANTISMEELKKKLEEYKSSN